MSCGAARTFSEPPATLAHGAVTLRFERILPAEPERQIVPACQFAIIFRGESAGRISLRVEETRHVLGVVGHIGYEVLPAWRGRRLALQACQALAPFVRTLLPRALLTVDPDNPASIRTIERLGAAFVGEFAVPPGDPHYASGSRRKRHYWWTP